MALELWEDLCKRAFNDDTEANDFVLFIEGCKVQQADTCIWTTDKPQYVQWLQQLGCQSTTDCTFTLSDEAVMELNKTKREARSAWHRERQITLKKHLDDTLVLVNAPLDITNEHRLALIKEFIKSHETDLGSVPFLRGLVGFLRFQLRDSRYVAEWKMNEYILTQNNEDAIESYIRLLRGILGLQLVYQDDEDDHSDRIAIDMADKEEPVLLWRMNPHLDDHFIHQVLKCLPKEHNTTQYQFSPLIERTQPTHTNLIQWIYQMITHCLSFLHK